ncbi:MAG TPA: hypothetical protein VJ903_01715 [Clostridia bacterium]|nr:hypothetical protein [Clostridia bacterium]
MPTISYKDNKSATTLQNINNVAPPKKTDGKVKTNLDATPNITQRGNYNALNNYGSPYESDTPSDTKSCVDTSPRTVLYRCSVCGVVHESNDIAPKSCLKCDNDKFYKVK